MSKESPRRRNSNSSHIHYTLISTKMKGIFIIFFIKILDDFVLTLEV